MMPPKKVELPRAAIGEALVVIGPAVVTAPATETVFLHQIEYTLPPLTLTQEEADRLATRLILMMQAKVEETLLVGYPPGYDPRTGMPGALHLDAKPSPYGKIIDLDGVVT